LVKLMHGELSLSSTLGTGTEVEVMLPVEWAPVFDSLGQPSAAVAEPVQGPVAGNGLRALVVEGTVINQHLLEKHFKGLGCEMLLAADAVQGLALFSAQKFDLVLMNCDLPGEDGYSLAGEFRELERRQQRPYCPIVAVSQVTGNQHLERCFDAGMDAVLNTPIDRDKLAQLIELWCEVTLVPLAQPLTAPVHKLDAGREALRKDLSALLEAVALRDRSLALQAASRLHGAALVTGWAGISTAVETLEPLLRNEMNWPAVAIAGHLSILVEQWADLNH
jgi:two-component system sensor histidine kinase EvgS